MSDRVINVMNVTEINAAIDAVMRCRKALHAVEWAVHCDTCPDCGARKPGPHTNDCEIAYALESTQGERRACMAFSCVDEAVAKVNGTPFCQEHIDQPPGFLKQSPRGS